MTPAKNMHPRWKASKPPRHTLAQEVQKLNPTMNNLQAYRAHPAITRDKFLAALRSHEEQARLVQGIYLANGTSAAWAASAARAAEAAGAARAAGAAGAARAAAYRQFADKLLELLTACK